MGRLVHHVVQDVGDYLMPPEDEFTITLTRGELATLFQLLAAKLQEHSDDVDYIDEKIRQVRGYSILLPTERELTIKRLNAELDVALAKRDVTEQLHDQFQDLLSQTIRHNP